MPNYLYNGVELPALPEWDKETYPYATIVAYSGFWGLSGYHLVISTVPLYSNENYLFQFGECVSNETFCSFVDVDPTDYVWDQWGDSSWDSGKSGFKNWTDPPTWANYDVEACDGSFNPLGTIYLYASEPVPVGGDPETPEEPETPEPTLTERDLYKKINGQPTKLTLYKKVGGELLPLDEYTQGGNL